MAVMIHVSLVIPPIALFDAARSQAILRREVGTAVSSIVEDIAGEARQRTPVGVSGILRASIDTRVTVGRDASTLVMGEVFTGAQAPYAVFVEGGRAPGKFPPWGPGSSLALWVQRIIGDVRLTFLIARAIARRGIRGRHMFRDALEQVRPTIEPRIAAAVVRISQALGGL
mgnify:CR=1 FL=1